MFDGFTGLQTLSERLRSHVDREAARFREEVRAAGIDEGINVAIGFDHDKGVAAHDGLLAVWIAFERFADTRRSPLGALAVELLCPRGRIVGAIGALLDPAGHAHVIDLAHAARPIAVVAEHLWHRHVPRQLVAEVATVA